MKTIVQLMVLFIGFSGQAATFEGSVSEWKNQSQAVFSDPEANFNLIFKKLKESYVDKGVTDQDLYRAAAAGMLAALNSGKEHEDWNSLLSPNMLHDFEIEKTGRLTGIGTTLDFDDKTGYARVLLIIPHSAAEKSGIKKDDLILSINGESYKGKKLRDMAAAIRGPAGERVHLNILRGDKVLNLNIVRDQVVLPAFAARSVNATTGLISISFFSNDTVPRVQEQLQAFRNQNIKRLVVDLRGNGGGTFDDAIKVGEIFVPKNGIIVQTRSRDGRIQSYVSHSEAWQPEAQIVVLVDKDTASSAELLSAALRENRHAKIIGVPTQGKWNVQSVDTLPNHFAVKYSVMDFLAPDGRSYQGTGLKPDIKIDGPNGSDLSEIQLESNMKKRLEKDAPLKAAIELAMDRS